ncbi:hypothetical protein SELMODRAFT_444864 [Selaginella moellendorffii]|uniref:Uncharacterized protein n=1 Tax=Selaginella moellendorffii TaxID=88036 RepID=D8SDJ1_SELML|nr:hypothetical protein SELMODRAFT_444864 [Selaginella moellendorffii]
MENFDVEECPFWRRERVGVGDPVPRTSQMLKGIHECMRRYALLPRDQRRWAEAYGRRTGLGHFLFQVNHIEGEGFETLQATEVAMAAGALDSSGTGGEAGEAMRCLHSALIHQLQANGSQELSVPGILEVHKRLLGSTRPDIAGRLRRDEEIAFTATTIGLPHVFMWPSDIPAALERLVRDTNGELRKLSSTAILMHGGVTPFPNVLFAESMKQEPPFVDKDDYRECFEKAQAEQEFDASYGDSGERVLSFTKEGAVCRVDPPRELAALVIEGVYVGWKRLFRALDQAFQLKQATAWKPRWWKQRQLGAIEA